MDTSAKNNSIGAIIGIIIILAIILLGALYFWNNNAEAPLDDEQVNALNTQSESDEISSIEADLNATDIQNLDGDMIDAEAESNAETN